MLHSVALRASLRTNYTVLKLRNASYASWVCHLCWGHPDWSVEAQSCYWPDLYISIRGSLGTRPLSLHLWFIWSPSVERSFIKLFTSVPILIQSDPDFSANHGSGCLRCGVRCHLITTTGCGWGYTPVRFSPIASPLQSRTMILAIENC